MNKRVVIVGGILVAALAVAGVMALQSGLDVDTIAVEAQTVCDTITEKGVMETGTAVTQTAQVAGTVLEVCVQENQSVQAGDVLLRIDTTDLEQEQAVQQSVLQGYQAQLQQAQLGTAMTVAPAEYVAQLQEQMEICQSNYQTAERLYQNQQALYELGGVSALELENSQTAWLQAKAQLTEAQQRYENSSKRLQALQSAGGNVDAAFYNSIIQQAQSAVDSQQQILQQLELSLARCSVTASTSGIVTQLPVKNATQVQAGEPVAVILGQQEALAAFEILTSEAPLLHVGDAVTLTNQLRSGDEILQGHIAQIYDFAQQGVSALGLEEHRVKVLVAVENAVQQNLKDGYEIQGTFQLYQQENVLAVPNSALFESGGQWYVFLVQNQKAVQTPVEIGYQAVTVTEIKAGLQAGDVIVQNANTEGLADGVKVWG